MKRPCFDCLPSPEYSQPEFQFKRIREPESQNQFIQRNGDGLYEVFEPNSDLKQFKKLQLNEFKGLVVVFFGIMNSYMETINHKHELLTSAFNVDIVGISSNLHSNSFNFPLIDSFKIAKEYNVMDPLGGGVYPRDVIIIFDSNGVEKLQIPITICGRYVHNKPISDVLIDTLDELRL